MAATGRARPTLTALRDGAGVAGLASIIYGAWLIYQPAAFIIGGAMLAGGAYLLARRSG